MGRYDDSQARERPGRADVHRPGHGGYDRVRFSNS